MSEQRQGNWLVVTVRVPSEELSALLAEGLVASGASAIEEHPGAFVTYLAFTDAPEDRLALLRTQLHEFTGLEPELEWDVKPERDWAEEWKRGLQPRRVGERLVVAPSWTSPELRQDDVLIEIDPEMAFGTGEHASTRGVLRLLERVIQPGVAVLDVGSGSGILAIAAAKLGAVEVLAVESDADAIINARDNLVRNGVMDRTELVHGLVDLDYLGQFPAHFDIILANILSGVIIPLLPGFAQALKPGGALITGGILQSEADQVIAAAKQHGFTAPQEDREEEWWSGLLLRSSAEAPPAP